MDANFYIHAIYDDEDLLIEGVKKIRERGIKIKEVYTPFPVHGLDSAIGLKKTKLSIMAFIYGMVGLVFSIWMTNYMMIIDWPQDIGGKPSGSWFTNMPSFVPLMFELAVFFSAHFMVITYLFRSKLYPFKKAENPDLRTTDDKFLIEISVSDNKNLDIENILKETKISEIIKK